MKGRVSLLLSACFAILTSCSKQNEPKVEALQSQVAEAQSNFAKAQAQIIAAHARNAKTLAELENLRNLLREQSAKIDEQANTIESQESRIEELNRDMSLLLLWIGQNPDVDVDAGVVEGVNREGGNGP